MKEWTSEDLILFYYGELTNEENQSLARRLASDTEDSRALKLEYAELVKLLDDSRNESFIPPPRADLNHFVMQGIPATRGFNTYLERVKHTQTAIFDTWGYKHLSVTFGLAFLLLAAFNFSPYLINSGAKEEYAVEIPILSKEELSKASKRIYLTMVSQHLENNERMLTQVINHKGGKSKLVEARKEPLAELIMLNRLYRRIALQHKDFHLAQLLEQTEVILQSLLHSNLNSENNFNSLRERIEGTDLLFKLRATKNSEKGRII